MNRDQNVDWDSDLIPPDPPEESDDVINRRKETVRHWTYLAEVEGGLDNACFSFLYTDHFSIPSSFYPGKKILDIGCGPRGTLEWAVMAEERVGIDPLVDEFRALGIEGHHMRYVKGVGENLPFHTDHFDVVSIFSVLPHTEDPEAVVREACRVLKPGRYLLLITKANEAVSGVFTHAMSWDVVDLFQAQGLTLLELKHYEFRYGLYDSIRIGRAFDHTDPEERVGALSAKFQKRE